MVISIYTEDFCAQEPAAGREIKKATQLNDGNEVATRTRRLHIPYASRRVHTMLRMVKTARRARAL